MCCLLLSACRLKFKRYGRPERPFNSSLEMVGTAAVPGMSGCICHITQLKEQCTHQQHCLSTMPAEATAAAEQHQQQLKPCACHSRAPVCACLFTRIICCHIAAVSVLAVLLCRRALVAAQQQQHPWAPGRQWVYLSTTSPCRQLS